MTATLDPSLQHTSLDKAEVSEQMQASLVVDADVDIELAQPDVLLGIGTATPHDHSPCPDALGR